MMLGIGLVEEWEVYLHRKHNGNVLDDPIAAVEVMYVGKTSRIAYLIKFFLYK